MPSYSSYRRPIPVLPPAESLSFPGNLVCSCSDCDLRTGVTRPVPGEGTQPAYVMLLGQNPGKEEDIYGHPFIGKAGQQLEYLLFQCGINREDVYITNVCKCLTRNNAPPKPAHVLACSRWLNIELNLVQPKIIVAMGAFAIRAVLGDSADTVEHLHGRPIEKDGRIILPCYHPAAGLHDTSTLRFLAEDFQVLRGLLQGKTVADYTIKDEYPSPDYRVVDNSDSEYKLGQEIHDSSQGVAIDVETVNQDTKLWSVQISTRPGTGWFTKASDNYKPPFPCNEFNKQIIVHHYLSDTRWLDIPEDNFFDSMIAAYLLGLPQGLKALASRLCGMKMKSYTETTRSGQQKISLQYLVEATSHEFPDPPEIEETKWDNKIGRLVTKIKKPWHISRKITKLLSDFGVDDSLDLYDRWKQIPDNEKECVEKVLGVMPESSLADIAFEDAVQYATRDADATIRVKLKLEQLIHEAGLDFVLHMDTAILPMVREMMDTGMAVDLDHLRNLSVDYDARMRAKSTELANVVGHPFNPSSSQQVAQVVYTELGFKPTRLTPTGEVSTDDQELKKTGSPVAKGIIEYRRLSKMKGTYTDNLVRSSYPDDMGVPRIHTVLTTTRVGTGRLSSKKGDNGEGAALQNIPTRSKEGKSIKTGFIAPGGKLLLEGDLCLVPETRVLTDDYRWIPIKDTHIGDVLIGITEDLVKCYTGRGYKRVFAPAKVEAIVTRKALCCDVRFADGRVLTCTGDHPWLARETNGKRRVKQIDGSWTDASCWGWVKTSDLIVGNQVANLVKPWEKDKTWEGGFLAGAFDGEGSIGVSRGNTLQFTQKMNYLLVTVFDLLARYGFKFHGIYEKKGSFNGSGSVCSTWICNNNEIMRFLGMFRPPRLLDRCPADRLLFGKVPLLSGEFVISVTPVGYRDVVNLQTSSHTFVAEGFVSHNCQVEMRTQAHLADCRGLINLFLSGKDPHTTTASKIFNVSYEEAKKSKYRYPCKRAGFGIIYLIGARGLHDQIVEYISDLEMEGEPVDIDPWSEEDCQKFIDDYYILYPEIKDYQMEQASMARRYGYTVDIVGRRRFIPEVMCPVRSVQEAGLRQAANFPVTSSAQAIIKMAMGSLWRELPTMGWRDRASWLMQIHDSLIVELDEQPDFTRDFVLWMRSIVGGVIQLKVPVTMDFKMGKSWGTLKGYEP